MSGDLLALGVVGALAAVGVLRRGSTSRIDDLRASIAEDEARVARLSTGELGAFQRKLLERAEARLAELRRQLERTEVRETMRRSHDHDFEDAMAHAERLAELVRAQPGAPRRVSAWGKKGVGARVYFPGELGFVSVGWDGSVSTTSRGQQTLSESAMYRSWRTAWRAGRAAYLAELEAGRER